jgi:ABC-type nitrate/sulfonate/bicarbonate transport system ATPase subunit
MQALPEKERRSKVNEYLDLMELSGFERHYPSQLSQGMQQRVSLARAYANEPEILLMDEPFASLDAQTAMRMRELLLRIWSERRKTIVFVTHDIDEAIHLADRVLLMTSRPGRIKKEFLIELSRPRSWEFYSDSRYTELRSAMRSALLNE